MELSYGIVNVCGIRHVYQVEEGVRVPLMKVVRFADDNASFSSPINGLDFLVDSVPQQSII